MRLFIAIDISEELKKTIASGMHDLKLAGVKGRFVPMVNLHQTLAFLGDVKDKAPVYDALKDIRFKPFRLSLAAYQAVGKALTIAPKGNQGLSALARDVRSALDQAGIDYDHKPFVPHITLMRDCSGNWKGVKAPKGDMTVKTFEIMKSEERDGKRVYTVLHHVGAG
ncbi:MAG: RNA 2',3'-cyclic phosphodiesterase [Lachnospiraceae bacterium]|nr:RNA 2',3'-cyclic phosphodiesterase [Lachnospiraceae bacterium]